MRAPNDPERRDLIERFADCRSVDELPPELRDNPFIRHIVSMTPEEEAEVQALIAAGLDYGDDAEREIADLEAGQHPLQQNNRPSR